jgi:hypothetical protein
LCDSELVGTIDPRQFAAHPLGHDGASGLGEGVGGAFGTVAVPVDALLGQQAELLQPGDRVVQGAVGDRGQPVVVALAHQPDHLVGVHVALTEQGQHHDTQRCEAVGAVGGHWFVRNVRC